MPRRSFGVIGPNSAGRENIRLTCSLLGMGDGEIDARIPDIIAFAKLGGFIDYPVRTDSAGMSLRVLSRLRRGS